MENTVKVVALGFASCCFDMRSHSEYYILPYIMSKQCLIILLFHVGWTISSSSDGLGM